jgi:hypothetical protein
MTKRALQFAFILHALQSIFIVWAVYWLLKRKQTVSLYK